MPDKVVIEIEYRGMYDWHCDMCAWGEVANYDKAKVEEYVSRHMLIYHGVTVDEIKTTGVL